MTTTKTMNPTTPNRIYTRTGGINWADFETAYGTADRLPFYLRDLFCDDRITAMNAAQNLWRCLRCQLVFITSAALPSYEFLMIGLRELEDDTLVAKILDIMLGYAYCSSVQYHDDRKYINLKRDDAEYDTLEIELRHKLISDIDVFNRLALSYNQRVAYLASEIILYLMD